MVLGKLNATSSSSDQGEHKRDNAKSFLVTENTVSPADVDQDA